MKWLVAIGLAAVSGGSLTLLVWRTVGSSPAPGPPRGVEREPARSRIEGIGIVEPASEVRRLMFRAGGVIRSCLVQTGDKVRQGNLLIELDNSTQRADLELARRQLDQARADAADINAGVNPYRLKVLEHTLDRLARSCVMPPRTSHATTSSWIKAASASKITTWR